MTHCYRKVKEDHNHNFEEHNYKNAVTSYSFYKFKKCTKCGTLAEYDKDNDCLMYTWIIGRGYEFYEFSCEDIIIKDILE